MAALSSKSMTEEIIDAIKDKTYDSCVSNLTKTNCVNLKKFRRDDCLKGHGLLPKGLSTNLIALCQMLCLNFLVNSVVSPDLRYATQ